MARSITIATSRGVARRAAFVALPVGLILGAIDYADKLIAGALTALDAVKIAVTFLVPYGVSTVSSVLAVMEREREAVTPPGP